MQSTWTCTYNFKWAIIIYHNPPTGSTNAAKCTLPFILFSALLKPL